jgi:hypothetical protein
MDLPPPIRSYFDADAHGDAGALVATFAPDASVTDEGRTHRGPAEIGAWWAASKSQYQPVLEPLSAETDGDRSTVRTRVSGDFPGSPVTLAFAFMVTGDHIARLEIAA